MAFEIFPQTIQLFPEEVQTLTLRAGVQPVLWQGFTLSNSQVQGPSILVANNTSSSDSAEVVQRAVAGNCSAEYEFLASMVPTSTGRFSIFLISTQSLLGIEIRVTATTTTIRNAASTVLQTLVRTPLAGDKWRINLAGDSWQVYLNGAYVGGYAAPSASAYPIRTFVSWVLPLTGGLTVVGPPALEGDWRIITARALWTHPGPVGGTFAIVPPTMTNQNTYTVGSIGGPFEIRAEIESQATQRATAWVIVPPLTIDGEDTVSMNPAAVMDLKTNYDRAQKKLVTWSLISGSGTLSGARFTAPAAPGQTVLRASYANQRDDLTVNTLAVVTQSQPAATPGEVLTLTTNIPSPTFTADAGTLLGAGSTRTWTAPSQDQIEARILVTGGGFSKTIKILTAKAFPYDPSPTFEFNAIKDVVVSTAADRRRWSRTRNAGGLSYEQIPLLFNNRDLAEYNAARTFWDEHYPDKRFIYQDKIRNIRRVLYFDSALNAVGDASCALNYSFQTREG